MIPTERFRAATDETTTPFLFWSDVIPCLGGAALACPQCAAANLHLETIHFAVPTEDHYTPTVGVSITPHTGAIAPGDEARGLHAGTNRGPMLAIGYRCEKRPHRPPRAQGLPVRQPAQSATARPPRPPVTI
jgi:hypothetical protein